MLIELYYYKFFFLDNHVFPVTEIRVKDYSSKVVMGTLVFEEKKNK